MRKLFLKTPQYSQEIILRPATLFKKKAQMFSYEYCDITKFIKTLILKNMRERLLLKATGLAGGVNLFVNFSIFTLVLFCFFFVFVFVSDGHTNENPIDV